MAALPVGLTALTATVVDGSKKSHELVEETHKLGLDAANSADRITDLLAVTKRLGIGNEDLVTIMSHVRRSVADRTNGNKEFTKSFAPLWEYQNNRLKPMVVMLLK